MTASQPFTTVLISSNMKMFKYCWVWGKSRATGYFDVQYRPMKTHEDVCVFGFGGVSNGSNPRMNYYPQGIVLLNTPKKHTKKGIDATSRSGIIAKGEQQYTNFPKSIIKVSGVGSAIHPTQKPVALMEYLIKTYTNEGETVLDFAAGSFTTAIAADNLGREWIGIEKERKYCDIGLKRINDNRIRLGSLLFGGRNLDLVDLLDFSEKEERHGD